MSQTKLSWDLQVLLFPILMVRSWQATSGQTTRLIFPQTKEWAIFFLFPAWCKLNVFLLLQNSNYYHHILVVQALLSWSCHVFQLVVQRSEGHSKHMAEAHLKERVHLDCSPHLSECSSTTQSPSGRWLNCRDLVFLTSCPHEKLLSPWPELLTHISGVLLFPLPGVFHSAMRYTHLVPELWSCAPLSTFTNKDAIKSFFGLVRTIVSWMRDPSKHKS